MHTYKVYEYMFDDFGEHETCWTVQADSETDAKRQATATALVGHCLYLCEGEHVLAKKSFGRWYKK